MFYRKTHINATLDNAASLSNGDVYILHKIIFKVTTNAKYASFCKVSVSRVSRENKDVETLQKKKIGILHSSPHHDTQQN